MAVLITGGARSGKSKFAERYAATLNSAGVYIATSQVLDDEMRERVERHRARRTESGFSWETVEESYDLCGVLRTPGTSPLILIDCLTLWLTNWLLRYEHEDPETNVMKKIEELAQLWSVLPDHVIAVTNEVGDGLVPEYPLGRKFRDLAGIMNQRMAGVSNKVFLVTAGIPIELKSHAFHLAGDEDEDGWAN